jgi:hypothetical protein
VALSESRAPLPSPRAPPITRHSSLALLFSPPPSPSIAPFPLSTSQRTYYDDVYCLDPKAKTWTQIFRCDIETKLAAGRFNVMVPGANAPLIVAMAKGAVGEQLEVVDTLDAEPMLDPKRGDFKEVMFNHVKQSLDDMGKLMNLVNTDLARGPSLVEGDIPNLKKVMGAVKKMKDDGPALQFELDLEKDRCVRVVVSISGSSPHCLWVVSLPPCLLPSRPFLAALATAAHLLTPRRFRRRRLPSPPPAVWCSRRSAPAATRAPPTSRA